MSLSGLVVAGMLSGSAVLPAQSDMPIIPPPSQRQLQQQQPRPPTPAPSFPSNVTSMEILVRQGYEVRAMQQYGDQAGRFVVMLQRSGDVKTCLMAIASPPRGTPTQRTACF